ncbi:hypothetical protein IVB26_06270 [Bradyrhizobium sp. 195]|uniref:hypothetical protein n=1 Tax=Bradyrhizobium sp. 195 TaxID=2782662 RepID=UPI0020018643|nr:hypothetical protein [Bradyrhizobium sp. 195]UPK28149.1 hypothetical protein IVB26_06270 [Bradyrhizobium sp. 195]
MSLQLHHVSPTSPAPPAAPHPRDPEALACLRHYSCHASAETIVKALTGSYRAERLFALEQALAL